jgi:hypothetical protein
MKNVKQARINVTLKKLFRYWLELTSSFHKLTKGETDVLALFLYYHYILKKDITNEKILWRSVFDYNIKKKIEEELDISSQMVYNNLYKFRKKGIIQNNKIVSTYITVNLLASSDSSGIYVDTILLF